MVSTCGTGVKLLMLSLKPLTVSKAYVVVSRWNFIVERKFYVTLANIAIFRLRRLLREEFNAWLNLESYLFLKLQSFRFPSTFLKLRSPSKFTNLGHKLNFPDFLRFNEYFALGISFFNILLNFELLRRNHSEKWLSFDLDELDLVNFSRFGPPGPFRERLLNIGNSFEKFFERWLPYIFCSIFYI